MHFATVHVRILYIYIHALHVYMYIRILIIIVRAVITKRGGKERKEKEEMKSEISSLNKKVNNLRSRERERICESVSFASGFVRIATRENF